MKKIFCSVIAIAVIVCIMVPARSYAESPLTSKEFVPYSKPIELQYFRSLPDSDEPVNVGYYKELEKMTDIKITFIDVSKDVQLQKLMLMVAAGDVPDIIEFPWRRHAGLLENMAEMGAIIELDGLINDHAPNLNGIFLSNREIKRQITSDNGHIYHIPEINLSGYRVTTGPVIRGDLLKKYGLKAPGAIEAWEAILTVFRDNERAMEPLSFDVSVFEESHSFIGAFGIPYGFGVRNGKVFYGPIEDSYKEFLATFCRWYQNGLIDREFALLRGQQLNNKVNSGRVGAFIGRVDELKDSINAVKSLDPSFELIPVQNPFKPGIDKLDINTGIPFVAESGIAISSRNKYPEETMKLIDLGYGEEGYRVSGYRTDESIDGSSENNEQKEAVRLWSDDGYGNNPSLMPPVTLTRDESIEFSAIMDNLSVYTLEYFVKCVLGAESLDSYEKYVETAKKLGSDRATEIMQAALDRYNKRLPKLKVVGKIINTDTEPVVFTEDGMLLPIRFVMEGIGGSVAWNDKNKIVTAVRIDTVITIKLNSSEVLVNYEPVTNNIEIRLINNRTYVPADFIQEVFGHTISYDEKNRTVTITNY